MRTYLFRRPELGLDQDVLLIPGSFRQIRYSEWSIFLGLVLSLIAGVPLLVAGGRVFASMALNITLGMVLLLSAVFLLVGLVTRLLSVDFFVLDRRNRTVTVGGQTYGPDDVLKVFTVEYMHGSSDGGSSMLHLNLGLVGAPAVWPDGEPSSEDGGEVYVTTFPFFDREWGRELATQLALMLSADFTEEGEYRNALTLMERTYARR